MLCTSAQILSDGDGLLKGIAVPVDAQIELVVSNSELSRPVFQDQRFAVVREPEIVLHVPHLFRLCGPAAVGGVALLFAFIALAARVMLQRVDAVKGVLGRWCLANILNERLNRLTPSLANVVTNAAIPAVIIVLAVIAAKQHLRPHGIFASSGKAVCFDASDAASASDRALALRAVNVSFQMIATNDSLCAADATAKPVTVIAYGISNPNNSDAAERLSRLVFERARATCTLRSSHSSYSSYGMWLEPASVDALRPARLILADSSARGEQSYMEIAA